MKNNILIILLMFILFLLGCATVESGLLRFQDRELLIHPDKSGLGYPYTIKKCKRKFFIKTCKTVKKVDFYDLNKKEVRQKLINAGFRCTSKLRFKY